MLNAIATPYLAPFDHSFRWKTAPTAPANAPDRDKCKHELKSCIKKLSKIQRKLYAHNYHSVLLIFQAMDSAGKDGTIRAVMSGLNPAGCQVYSFKQPSQEELDHDFLWRTTCRLPERGRIGVFNRSYYEEVLVVRVHPELLQRQRVDLAGGLDQVWRDRYDAIRHHERHLAQSGTLVLKFWLHISREEQRQRFISRLEEPEKHWKFSEADIRERQHWDEYMHAYQQMVNETSRPWAPWYVIPGDNKPYTRMRVGQTILANIETLKLHYPVVTEEQKEHLKQARVLLKDRTR